MTFYMFEVNDYMHQKGLGEMNLSKKDNILGKGQQLYDADKVKKITDANKNTAEIIMVYVILINFELNCILLKNIKININKNHRVQAARVRDKIENKFVIKSKAEEKQFSYSSTNMMV